MSDSPRFYHNKKVYLVIGVLIAACIVLIIFLNDIIMPAYTHHDEGVTVPNVTRLSLKDAKHMLKASGLRGKVLQKRSNNAFPPHYVVDQNPGANQIVKPGRKIYLTVSIVSHPTIKMPNLKGLSLRNARLQLENSGLGIGTISYEPGRFKNTVLHQSISPKKTVAKGTEVDMVVSNGLGKKRVVIPDIIGLNLTEAEQKMQKKGLRVGQIRYKETKKVAPNTVLDYYPKVTETVKGSTLQFVVSEQPGPGGHQQLLQHNDSTSAQDTISTQDTVQVQPE